MCCTHQYGSVKARGASYYARMLCTSVLFWVPDDCQITTGMFLTKHQWCR